MKQNNKNEVACKIKQQIVFEINSMKTDFKLMIDDF